MSEEIVIKELNIFSCIHSRAYRNWGKSNIKGKFMCIWNSYVGCRSWTLTVWTRSTAKEGMTTLALSYSSS